MDEQVIFTGEVVWFNIELNYGFIAWESNSKKQTDMFVHFSDIDMDGFKLLKAGQKVSFAVGQNHAGNPKAINVKIIG